jgi:2-oxoglutarate ferredoxin oxidoreductase subunit alpha
LTGAKGRPRNIITSVYLEGEALERTNQRLQAKLQRLSRWETRYEEVLTGDADILIVAFGTVARIAKTAIRQARQQGLRVGLLRPITLFPFPTARLEELAGSMAAVLVVEMNAGQMVDDVRLAVKGAAPVEFLGHTGGVVPWPTEILARLNNFKRRRQVAPTDWRERKAA